MAQAIVEIAPAGAASRKRQAGIGVNANGGWSTIRAPNPGGSMADPFEGLDAHWRQAVADWNAPGLGVTVVRVGEVAFSGGWGFRDFSAGLPFTPSTVFPIASNTKLFTAVAAGLLVQEGRLSWDRPIREAVPAIKFHSDALDASVTLRDMLAHRTGIHRHDTAWNRSAFTTRELFERLRYLEPVEPLRQSFIYNNLMYAAVGHVIELVSGEPWAGFVRRRLLAPLGMAHTFFSHEEVQGLPELAVAHTEARDSREIRRIPPSVQMRGAAPAGGMWSTQEDLARWLAMLMADGVHEGVQVVPAQVLHETLAPAVALPNQLAQARGFWEILNSTYGMGRHTAIYRGHPITFHGGTLSGVHSQVAYLPRERVGVIAFVIGDHCATLRDNACYTVFERVLGLDPTPWDARWQEVMGKLKDAMQAARGRAGAEHVPGTQPSHPLADYAGTYDHPLYGALEVTHTEEGLALAFRGPAQALRHVHYERFDTDDDEWQGKWTLNFSVDALGDVGSVTIALDQAETRFTRRPPRPGRDELEALAGTYVTATGLKWQVVVKDGDRLFWVLPGSPDWELAPWKPMRFRIPQFSDRVYAFELEEGRVARMKITAPEGVYLLRKA